MIINLTQHTATEDQRAEAQSQTDAEIIKSDDNEIHYLLQQLAASQAREQILRESVGQWIGIASNCSIESGCCHCGDSMKNHASPFSCGHSPVDMADAAVYNAIKKSDEALALPQDTSALSAMIANADLLREENAVLKGWMRQIMAAIRDADRTARVMHTEGGQEVVCLEPRLWGAVTIPEYLHERLLDAVEALRKEALK